MAFDATLEIITDILPHPNADLLEIVVVCGFQNIVPKNTYNKRDYVYYIHTDAILPTDRDWSKKYLKYAVNRVKAINIRGVWSEGIIVPINEVYIDVPEFKQGMDISVELGVEHFVIPEPENDDALTSELPLHIKETDEKRHEGIELPYGELCDLLLKIDGKSNSYYYIIENEYFGVLGRKQEMKRNITNDYTIHIQNLDIENKLKRFCEETDKNLCLRGESYGVGISPSKINPHSKLEKNWKMFNVWLVDERRYARKGEEFYFLNVCDKLDLPVVDIIERDVILTPEIVKKYSSELTELNGKPFEGIVVQHKQGSFKIMNKYYDSKK